jgi:hypothetical protein
LAQPRDEAIHRCGKIRIALASRVCESAQLLSHRRIQIAHAPERSIQISFTDVGNHSITRGFRAAAKSLTLSFGWFQNG